MSKQRVLIIGAGQAGSAVACSLRQAGFVGAITICGDEPAMPYQRPPLSKAYLKGMASFESLVIRPRSFYAERDIVVYEERCAITLDIARRRVGFNDGGSQQYDILVIATGSRPRRLPISSNGLSGIHELRTLADAEKLKSSLGAGARLVLVGGGFIGLEVAASAISMGGEAIIVEREPRLLARVASEPLSRFLEVYHARKGVKIFTSATVAGIAGNVNRHVSAVCLSDGSSIPCDAVLVCAGGEPNEALARDAGIDCDGGIIVDIDGRTSEESVFAIGDVSRRPLPLYGDKLYRIESVPNAIEQSKQVVAAIMGQQRPQPETPWFWSDQFDLRLKIAGIPIDADQILMRGSPSEDEFSVLHFRDGRLLCLESVNTTADFMAAKALIARGRQLTAASLTDANVALKSFLE